MSTVSQDFESAGYAVVERVISAKECEELTSSLPPIESSGSRALLSLEVFRSLYSSYTGAKRWVKDLAVDPDGNQVWFADPKDQG